MISRATILLCALWAVPVLAASNGKVCVLSFLPEGDKMANSIVDTFRYDRNATLVQEAIPKDFLNCLKGDFAQVVMVAHAFEIGSKADIKLGYFVRAPGQPAGPAAKYAEKIFLDHVFEVADQTPTSVKEIRLMACDPAAIESAYPSFGRLLADREIRLDVAPTSVILSAFSDVPVTPFNLGWLAQSTDCSEAAQWKTDANDFCKSDDWPGCDRRTAKYCIPTAN